MFDETVRQHLKTFLLNKVRSDLNTSMCYMSYLDRYDDCGEEDFSAVCDCCNADSYYNGVSKITLFYNELPDWVIKVPILGSYYEDEDNYCDYTESGSTVENDYCLAEADYCQEAVKQNIGECFAKTYYICDIQGISFYCSEKVALVYRDVRFYDADNITHTSPESMRRAQNLMSKYDSYLDTPQLALFIDAYGEHVTQTLLEFLFDFNVTDLHYGNLGFDADNHIKIIDCAGWRD